MAETLLITKDDIREIYPELDVNLDVTDVDPYSLRSQQTELKEFLGQPLYYDFVTNVADSKYQELLNGTEYEFEGHTVFFGGVKPMLCAWSFSKIMKNINVQVARASVVQKDTEESTPHDNDLIVVRSREITSEAIRLQAEVQQFLEDNRSTYTLWSSRMNAQADQRTSFKIHKIPRHRQL